MEQYKESHQAECLKKCITEDRNCFAQDDGKLVCEINYERCTSYCPPSPTPSRINPA